MPRRVHGYWCKLRISSKNVGIHHPMHAGTRWWNNKMKFSSLPINGNKWSFS